MIHRLHRDNFGSINVFNQCCQIILTRVLDYKMAIFVNHDKL